MNTRNCRSVQWIQNRRRAAWAVALVLTVAAFPSRSGPKPAQEATIEVAADKPGPAISPMLYGLMTEEINHSYDGGLCAELIRNRAFKEVEKNDPTKPAWWSVSRRPAPKRR